MKTRADALLSLRISLSAALMLALGCNLPAFLPVEPTEPAQPSPMAEILPVPTVLPPEGAIPSPDGRYYALMRGGLIVLLEARSGEQFDLVQGEQITGLSWFPDSQHLAYSERLTLPSGFPGIEDRIWIVDLETRLSRQVELGYSPSVSPGGGHLAMLLGSPVGDACVVGFSLGILLLNSSLQPTAVLRQGQIDGLPPSLELESFHPVAAGDLPPSGRWLDENTLQIAMRWACQGEEGENGVYRIDVQARSARRISELPSP